MARGPGSPDFRSRHGTGGVLLDAWGVRPVGRAPRGEHQVSPEEKPAGAEAPLPEPGRPYAGQGGGKKGPGGPPPEGPPPPPGAPARRAPDAEKGREKGRAAKKKREPAHPPAHRRSSGRSRLSRQAL